MTREQLLEKSLESLREIAKAQGVKSITKYRKAELVEIIMNSSVYSEKESLSCRCCSEACRQISRSFGSKKHIEERGETK